jgi:hypothetical protein
VIFALHLSQSKTSVMKKFVIERNFPGAGELSAKELASISKLSCDAINQLAKPYQWEQSYVCGDKIYCIHLAENEEVLREHARIGKFPINTISEVITIIDPSTAGK